MVLEPDTDYARAIRSLADRMKTKRAPGRAACIIVASDQMRAGGTSAAISLARSLVRDGKTVIVDLNVPRPGLGRMLAAPRPDGLSNVIAGEVSFADAIHRDRGSRAHVLPIGDATVDVMQSDLLPVALDALSQTYDFMVIDSGLAARQRPDLVRGADLVLLVARGAEQDPSVAMAQTALRRSGAKDITIMVSAEDAPAPAANDSGPIRMASAG